MAEKDFSIGVTISRYWTLLNVSNRSIHTPGRVEPSDDHLLYAINGKDERAFDELYLRTAPAVARLAWSLTNSRDAVEELVQETFLLVWRKPAKVRLVNESALPWLLVTCRNLAHNRSRRERRTTHLFDQDAMTSDDSAILELRWVLDSLANLQQTDRRVCELVLLQGLTYREAAERLLISEASVGKRLHRSRQQLRRDVDR